MEGKNVGGRPPKYKNKKQMEEAINKYFEECKLENRPITFTGLAYSLGLSRQGLLNYSKDERFFDTIKRARDYVEITLEERLIGTSGVATGIIFNLKNNYGWNDKQEIDANVKNEIVVSLEDD